MEYARVVELNDQTAAVLAAERVVIYDSTGAVTYEYMPLPSDRKLSKVFSIVLLAAYVPLLLLFEIFFCVSTELLLRDTSIDQRSVIGLMISLGVLEVVINIFVCTTACSSRPDRFRLKATCFCFLILAFIWVVLLVVLEITIVKTFFIATGGSGGPRPIGGVGILLGQIFGVFALVCSLSYIVPIVFCILIAYKYRVAFDGYERRPPSL